MKIKGLVKNIGAVEGRIEPELDVTGISYDSRAINPGEIFVCIKGTATDGHLFLEEAWGKGAVLAIVEDIQKLDIPQIKVSNSRQALAKLANIFFDIPSQKVNLVGVTGTNGKTTTTFLLREIFKAAGVKTGLIGTVQYQIGDENFPVERTTPESADLQRLLKQMVDAKVQVVVMEVSSHAADMYRVEGCQFKAMVFTNLSQDHLDYHGDMETYFKAKAKLFKKADGQTDLINLDDNYGQQLSAISKNPQFNFAIRKDGQLVAERLSINKENSRFWLKGARGQFEVKSHLTGTFNVYNSLAAAAASMVLGIEQDQIKAGLESLKSVPGRFEVIKEGQDFTAVVDYAHTPDGIEKALLAAREISEGKVSIVFGAGGDRDRLKRPLMGKVASKYADMVFLTADNPRREEVLDIIDQIKLGIETSNFQIVPKRKEAICTALQAAKSGDVVVIAGKGHEEFQIFKDRTVAFSDQEVAREFLRQSRK